MNLPTSELEASRYFANEDHCIKFVAAQRWPNGVVCPTCGRTDVSYLKSQRRWQCKSAHPHRQFSVKTGTIFEDSPLGLNKWLPAIWKIVNSKNGVSSYELAASLHITQKSAWFLAHRIREALKAGNFEKLDGTTSADETYVGGRHVGTEHHLDNKTAIVGVVEHKKGTGQLRAFAVKAPDATNTMQFLRDNVAAGATLYTDESGTVYWDIWQTSNPSRTPRWAPSLRP
jgi:transposase-like protein